MKELEVATPIRAYVVWAVDSNGVAFWVSVPFANREHADRDLAMWTASGAASVRYEIRDQLVPGLLGGMYHIDEVFFLTEDDGPTKVRLLSVTPTTSRNC